MSSLSEQILFYMFLNLKKIFHNCLRFLYVWVCYFYLYKVSNWYGLLWADPVYEDFKIEFLLVYTNPDFRRNCLPFKLYWWRLGFKALPDPYRSSGQQVSGKANQAYTKFLNTKLDQRAVKILEYIYDNYEDDSGHTRSVRTFWQLAHKI